MARRLRSMSPSRKSSRVRAIAPISCRPASGISMSVRPLVKALIASPIRRIIWLQRRELLIQCTFGFVGAFFGKVKQADGEVGQPVFQITEGLLRGAGGAKYLDIVGFGA